MPFESLFRQSRGQPIVYKGRTVQMVDRLTVGNDQVLSMVFESADSVWLQGVRLDTDGSFSLAGRTIAKSVVLWRHSAPAQVILRVQSKAGYCSVRNVWDIGDGVVHSWHNGAAMIIEALPNGRRYLCNDGEPDDDFDDLVFRIETL